MKLNTILKRISFAAVMLISGSTFANPIVVLSENASDYHQTETGYVINFKLDATSSELGDLQAKVANMTGVVSMDVTLTSEGHYDVVYTVDHQNQPEYVHKMMLTCGFSAVKYQGTEFGLEKVIDVLYSFQEEE